MRLLSNATIFRFYAATWERSGLEGEQVPTALVLVDSDHDRLAALAGRDAIVFRVALRLFSRHGFARAGSIGFEPPE